jgi:hypothetical protein
MNELNVCTLFSHSQFHFDTRQWSHCALIGGCTEPGGQLKTFRSTTTSDETDGAKIVPHGGDVALTSDAESATPLMEFRRMICHRAYGPP